MYMPSTGWLRMMRERQKSEGDGDQRLRLQLPQSYSGKLNAHNTTAA